MCGHNVWLNNFKVLIEASYIVNYYYSQVISRQTMHEFRTNCMIQENINNFDASW